MCHLKMSCITKATITNLGGELSSQAKNYRMLIEKCKQLEESNQMLTQGKKELKEEKLREQKRLSQQMLRMNQQMQAFYQVQQAFDFRLQQLLINIWWYWNWRLFLIS